MPLRFTSQAATDFRRAVKEAEGVEVFAIGDVEGGQVVAVTITCRGTHDRVTALLGRPRAGQVVIHNHPSGVLEPSEPDLNLAGRFGENGVGFVIVDSEVQRDRWVVEPHAPQVKPIDERDVTRFFTELLPKLIKDFEPRPGQLDMARAVARALSENRPVVMEAGTGTGKSLAYLVPAALWALANDSKVVISTHTKALQGQLMTSDLPLLASAGLPVRYAVLQGRSNYVCKRRMLLASEEDHERPPEERRELEDLIAWEASSVEGFRGELGSAVDDELWERVESDTDLTLRARCPHFGECHFYNAKRRAAAAHLLIVNHALLLADLAVRDEGAVQGVLPKYERIVLDEAHHLEDSATGAVSERLSARMIDRGVAPLLSRKRRDGALAQLVARHGGSNSILPPDRTEQLGTLAVLAHEYLNQLKSNAIAGFSMLTADGLDAEGHPLRITDALTETERWKNHLAPQVEDIAGAIEGAAEALDALTALFAEIKVPEIDAQPLLDIERARKRLVAQAGVARSFLTRDEERCRWIEPTTRFDPGGSAIQSAPIEVGETLRRILWSVVPGAASTSATLSVAGRFDFFLRRVGLDQVETGILPSPFDHEKQALLALPRDLPSPEAPDFLAATAAIVVDAIRTSDGGAFVLCTSYAAVREYAAALTKALPTTQPVLVQDGKTSRTLLLQRFTENRRAVLVGTDTFWEGVSVKGEGLRLVIIPRLPFRVPTEPLRIARHERIAARGGDPFRHFSLPETAIKLRQGYGRLIRHRDDRGVVLLLDRRIHDRAYGAILLHALPPARRVSGPWARVREEMTSFYRGEAPPAPESSVEAFLARLRGTA